MQHLLFGRQGLKVALPKTCIAHEIRKKKELPIADPAKRAREALLDPVGLPPLSEFAMGSRSACILVYDITRPVPNGLLLSKVLAELDKCGLSREKITILIATGLHRPASEDEIKLIIGDWHVYKTVRVENHHANNNASHINLGNTSRGTPVILDRHFVEADTKVVIGLVEPHFMAGYSGVAKLLSPESLIEIRSWPFTPPNSWNIRGRVIA